ncbi:MAG TPA: SpoIIE family protein phosphatase [Tepidisphaeraceae bacterium]
MTPPTTPPTSPADLASAPTNDPRMMPDRPAELPASILVVDDVEANRDALARRLQRRGYTVATASDGPRALAMIEEQVFDAVLLDVMMPGMSGLEVLERVRRTKSPADLPIIMATAKDESADIVGALKLGANDYITKPIDFPVALARVQTQLTLRRAIQENRALEQSLSQRNAELEAANAQLSAFSERTKKELAAAAALQASYLPRTLPSASGVTFAWHFRPCTELAGDSLNVCRLDEQTLGLYVLDVSGHGVAASLHAVAATQQLSEGPESILMHRDGDHVVPTPPAEVVQRLDSRFRWKSNSQHFLTMFYALYHPATRRLDFASAAHPPAIHLSSENEVTLLESGGLPIGCGDGYPQQTSHLQPGDRVFIYSDGVTEALNAANVQIGVSRLVPLLQAAKEMSLDDAIRRILQAIEEWTDSKTFADDVSILAFEITP